MKAATTPAMVAWIPALQKQIPRNHSPENIKPTVAHPERNSRRKVSAGYPPKQSVSSPPDEKCKRAMTRMPPISSTTAKAVRKTFKLSRPLANRLSTPSEKSDIRSHRYGRSHFGPSSRRYEIIDQHRNQHTAARRHDG